MATTNVTRSYNFVAFAAVAIVASLVVSPFFWRGIASGHDFEFHAASWLDVASQWKQGVWYPRWAEWANWGFGEPRFIFYPPASWILGAALGLILPWKAAPGAFIWLAVFFSGVSMFFLARRWLPPHSAIFAAILYAANPYAIVVIYIRSDFAELLASSFLPLLVMYAVEAAALCDSPYEVGSRNVNSKNVTDSRASVSRATASLAIVFASIWLCNAPAGVLATYTLCVLMAAMAIASRSRRPVIMGAWAIALGFLVAGFFIVPAAFEQRWVNISEAFSSGLRPQENFLFTRTGDLEHNRFNFLVSAIAVGMLALAGGSAIALARSRKNEPRRTEQDELQEKLTRAAYWPLVALVVAVALLLVPITTLIWRWAPQLRFLQFPWRWLGPLGVPFAYFAAAAIGRARWRHLWQILLLAALAASGDFLARRAWWASSDLQVLQAAMAHGEGYEGTDEYDSLGDDHSDLRKGAPQVEATDRSSPSNKRAAAPRIFIERWAPEEKIIRIVNTEFAQIALRLLNYPAWRIEVNGHSVQPAAAPNNAQMRIAIPAGDNRVRVRLIRTADRTIGLLLSAMGIAALLRLHRWGRKEKRAAANQRRSTAG